MHDAPSDSTGRPWTRIGLVVGCLLAAVAVTFLMPAFAVDGLAGSPLEQVLPGEGADPTSGSGSGGGGGGLGALNPGSGTGVGGEIGLNSDTFASTNTEVHFTVESSQRTYWRTAAYGTYTGSGWERSTDTSSADGSIEHRGPDGERIDYEITLNKDASAVPTAYRPALINGVSGLQVTANGAIQPSSTLEAGTTIEGVSFAPRDDVDRLRSTQENYPTEIENRYTQLPDSTPDRVAERTATVFENADADDPYEKASAVQEYLRSSKEYDLDTSQRSESIADAFIFEMDAGYCEYFATSMAVMLRSQNIPTRYVIGYSSGQQVEPDTYKVRGMNAHAWVEVYFEDVGWIRFDPTPGNERLERQQEALSDFEGELDLEETGSPGEQFTPGGDGTNQDGEELGLSTSLNRTAVPGTAVELTVTYNDVSVPGVEVLFNGQSVGITDRNGVVVGTVPDAEELTVDIREGDNTTPPELTEALFGSDGELDSRTAVGSGFLSGATTSGAGTTTASRASTSFASGQPISTLSTIQTATDSPQDSHQIERTISIALGGEPVPGQELPIVARIGDVEIDGATVTVDGEAVGTTDSRGQFAVELPDRSGEVTISIERDSLSGQRTIRIPELTMSVETGPLGAHALRSATVTARLDGNPAAGVPVLRDGEEVAVTDANGTAQVPLPLSPETTLAVEASGQTVTSTLTGLLYVPAAVAVGVLSLLAVFALVLRRRGVEYRELARQIRSGIIRASVKFRQGFVLVVTDSDQAIAAVKNGLTGGLRRITGALTGKTSLGAIWLGFTRWLSGLGSGLRSNARADRPVGEPLTVREAWERFLDSVSANSAPTRTPGELADHAIEEDGLPEQAVTELRDTFREVEYGSRPPADRLERIQAALEQIERTDSDDQQ